jgi:hypothetical protein
MQLYDEFYIGMAPLEYLKKKRTYTLGLSADRVLRRQELIPDELLSSSAHFRFSSHYIIQNEKLYLQPAKFYSHLHHILIFSI